jgi:anti-sigma regulatory factor (Ser/Thr protein kinase)/anti-anti-sigma regulatory factor
MKSMQIRAEKICRMEVPRGVAENNFNGFFDNLDSLIKESPKEIILDCSALNAITSSHINFLWQVRIKCGESNIPLRLDSVSDKLVRVLQVLDLYDLFINKPGPGFDRAESYTVDSFEVEKRKLSLKFYSTVESIEETLMEFKGYLAGLNIPRIFAFELETVCYEVVTNIRLHSKSGGNDLIKLSVNPQKSKIILEFKYFGLPFDPTTHQGVFDPAEVARQRKTRGYGLAMIKRMTDYISYQRIGNDTNLLILEKCWGRNNE